MKLMIASDIHGSAYYCEKMIEAYRNEKADIDALIDTLKIGLDKLSRVK